VLIEQNEEAAIIRRVLLSSIQSRGDDLGKGKGFLLVYGVLKSCQKQSMSRPPVRRLSLNASTALLTRKELITKIHLWKRSLNCFLDVAIGNVNVQS
jgi:hypothetical protein